MEKFDVTLCEFHKLVDEDNDNPVHHCQLYGLCIGHPDCLFKQRYILSQELDTYKRQWSVQGELSEYWWNETQNKIKELTELKKQIKEICENGLKPICYKANCKKCQCYEEPKQTLADILNQYFTIEGEFNDLHGTFIEELEGYIESERTACNRAKPICEQILELLKDQ